MDIFIKSFTRPYYLAKCIFSIQKYIKGTYKIYVLDDGTAEIYLNKLIEMFPDINIVKSPYYIEKTNIIKKHLQNPEIPIPKLKIPSLFWKDHIGTGSKYFLLLEDDMWITEVIDIDKIMSDMEHRNISLVKTALFIKFLKKYDGEELSPQLVKIKPKLKFYNPHVFKKIFSENFLKSQSILSRLGLISLNTVMPVYAIYMVAGVFFEKEYYNFIWQNYEGYVNENYQLYNALKWYHKNPEKSYAKLRIPSLKTSLLSSATNSFKGVNLDPYVFNDVLSRAWLDGRLDVTNTKDDFEEKLIKDLLIYENKLFAQVEDWEKWTNLFKAQYILDFEL